MTRLESTMIGSGHAVSSWERSMTLPLIAIVVVEQRGRAGQFQEGGLKRLGIEDATHDVTDPCFRIAPFRAETLGLDPMAFKEPFECRGSCRRSHPCLRRVSSHR